jgi:hypothetical protein
VTDSEKVSEWIRYHESCYRKMNALVACLEADGDKVTNLLLQKLGLASALDVVKNCQNDHKGTR